MDNIIKKKLIIYSVISGILYPILLTVSHVGIGMPLFAIIQMILVYYLTKNRKEIVNKKALLMFIPIFILTLNYFISGSYIFNFPNLVIIFILYSIMILLLTDTLELESQGLKFIINIIITVFKPLLYFDMPIKWSIDRNKSNPNNVLFKKIVAGIIISVPLLIFICFLMMSADLVFESMVESVFGRLLGGFDAFIICKIILGVLAGFYLFGLFYIVFKKIDECKSFIDSEIMGEVPAKKEQDAVVLNIILTSTVLIYTIFVIIQFRYLFTGASLPNNLTYAQYARNGFFELLFLSFINIGLILITVYFTRNKTYDKNNKYAVFTKGLMLYLCFITVILLISSFYRMTLYNNEFGFTRLRILVIIFLVFETMGLLLTFRYIIKPKFNIVAFYGIICLIFYLTINVINIDYIIAKRNIDMYMNGSNLDCYYLAGLSSDAAFQMKRLINNENREIAEIADNYFESIANEAENTRDWRSFNISRYFASNR